MYGKNFDSDVIKLICETLISACQNRGDAEKQIKRKDREDRENMPVREEAKTVSLRETEEEVRKRARGRREQLWCVCTSQEESVNE